MARSHPRGGRPGCLHGAVRRLDADRRRRSSFPSCIAMRRAGRHPGDAGSRRRSANSDLEPLFKTIFEPIPAPTYDAGSRRCRARHQPRRLALRRPAGAGAGAAIWWSSAGGHRSRYCYVGAAYCLKTRAKSDRWSLGHAGEFRQRDPLGRVRADVVCHDSANRRGGSPPSRPGSVRPSAATRSITAAAAWTSDCAHPRVRGARHPDPPPDAPTASSAGTRSGWKSNSEPGSYPAGGAALGRQLRQPRWINPQKQRFAVVLPSEAAMPIRRDRPAPLTANRSWRGVPSADQRRLARVAPCAPAHALEGPRTTGRRPICPRRAQSTAQPPHGRDRTRCPSKTPQMRLDVRNTSHTSIHPS